MAGPLGRLIDPTGLLPIPGGFDPGPTANPLGWAAGKLRDRLSDTTIEYDPGTDYETRAAAILARAERATGKITAGDDRNDAIDAIIKQIKSGATDASIVPTVKATLKDFGEVPPKTPPTPGPDGLPSGWQKTTINGRVFIYDPADPTGTMQEVTGKEPSARSASQEAADLASANANNAQAGLYGAQAADLARIAKIAGKPVEGAPGYIYDQNGRPVDITQAKFNSDQLAEIARHNLQVELDNSARTANEELSTRQTGEYQQGQLGIERGRLAADVGRLSLDRQVQQANINARQQENALARNKYVADILGKPSDFMARVITQRGLGNPNPVTQADLINQINTEFAGLQPGQSLAPPKLDNPLGVPQLAMGGMVNDPMMIVGDPQQAGVPNPEVIHNPTGAPISVTPMNRLGAPQYAQGTPQQSSAQPQQDPMTKELENKVKSIGKLLQFVDNPDTQHELVDELATYKQKLGRLAKPPKQPNLLDDVRGKLSLMPQYAYGTTGQPDSITLDPITNQWSQGGKQVNPFDASGSLSSAGLSGVPTLANPLQEAANNAAWARSTPAAPMAAPALKPQAPAQPIQDPMMQQLLDAIGRLSQPMTLPAPNIPPAKSQAQLETGADEGASKIGLDRLFGSNFGKKLNTVESTPNPINTGINPLRFQFPLFSPQQLEQLTQDELIALNSYLGLKYNTTLQDVLDAQRQVYQAPSGRRLVRRSNA